MRWKLTYADSSSGMAGIEPAREKTIEVDLPIEGKDWEGADEQEVLDLMRARVCEHAGGHVVLTGAQPVN